MSNDWAQDINEMHQKFGVHEWFEKNKDNKELMRKYLSFRITMMYEELGEIISAANVQQNSEEVVDGLIDICVFAIGTLDVMGVDAHKAWDEILRANMSKDVGVKPGRPNPWGMPDMIKPSGWQPPRHDDNHGDLPKILE